MTALLTFCACIDPRRINPQTGHYPGCPDEIIPPECLLPPWEVRTTEERVYAGKGARSDKHPTGKPLYESVTRHELVEPVRASVPVSRSTATSSPATPSLSSAPCPVPCPVLVLDTETTGLRRQGHTVGVCEIGLAVIDLSPVPQAGGPPIVAKHAKLLHPGMPIPREASMVHGILDRDVMGAQHLCDVWPALTAWVDKFARTSSGEVHVIAHNAPYDRAVLFDALTDRGIPLPLHWRWFCSMQLARKALPGLPSYSLHDSQQKAGLATSLRLVKGQGHRAMGDVVTTVSLLGELRKKAGAWPAWCGQATDWKGEKAGEKAEKKPDQKTAPQKPASASAAPAPVAPVPSPAAPVQAPSVASSVASSAARPRPRKAALPPSMDLFARLPSTRQEPA